LAPRPSHSGSLLYDPPSLETDPVYRGSVILLRRTYSCFPFHERSIFQIRPYLRTAQPSASRGGALSLICRVPFARVVFCFFFFLVFATTLRLPYEPPRFLYFGLTIGKSSLNEPPRTYILFETSPPCCTHSCTFLFWG